MLKKTITFTDFDGNQRTEDHYFHLTKAEMLKYDAMYDEEYGGTIKYLTWLVEKNKTAQLVAAFEELILRAYGERLPNGKFIKSQEIRDTFAASEAYSELFLEITSSEENASNFINALFSSIPELKNASNVTPIPAPVG